MIQNIIIQQTNAFKSKNAKQSFKKLVKTLTNLETDKKLIAKTIENHISDFQKYFIDHYKIDFQILINELNFDINFTITKYTEKDINKIKLKKKLNKLDYEKKYLSIKRDAKKNFESEKDELKSDERVDINMIKLYYKLKTDFPESKMPTPIDILNNLEKYKEQIKSYIEVAETKNELEKYVLLKNNYCNYMSYMTKIEINISKDLEERYNTNNLKI